MSCRKPQQSEHCCHGPLQQTEMMNWATLRTHPQVLAESVHPGSVWNLLSMCIRPGESSLPLVGADSCFKVAALRAHPWSCSLSLPGPTWCRQQALQDTGSRVIWWPVGSQTALSENLPKPIRFSEQAKADFRAQHRASKQELSGTQKPTAVTTPWPPWHALHNVHHSQWAGDHRESAQGCSGWPLAWQLGIPFPQPSW